MHYIRAEENALCCAFRRRLTCLAAAAVALAATLAVAGPIAEPGRLALDGIAGAKFKFAGPMGQRVTANVENWLLVAPKKNPGLVEMFAERDSGKPLDLVPWAGEFVGKYLISAAEALRISDDPRLRQTVDPVVDRLVQLQADDGYLGPWPKPERLLGHWDLWGHYHVILGLILWHEQTGSPKALAAARKAADLVCNTFLDTGRRVASAGSAEMNMGIIHGLAILYRKTGEPRYLRMAKEVLKDFEQAGDYYRQGLSGQEYFRTPRPRWESLHSLQGLVELYRTTGDESFRRCFLHHWASIRRFDFRNTGGFSAGEQATGNPFSNDAIETCCVIAWEAVMIDALRLTGDSTIADDIELATLNAVAGAQHPSGEWCTYNTPMNGSRGPSHVQIAFQARPGAMFLNCCSVNGPRGLGMLGQWAVMRGDDGLAVNYYGPMQAELPLADGTPVTIQESTDYPLGDTVRLKIVPPAEKQFTLTLRIPAWSAKSEVLLNGQPSAEARPGTYLKLSRVWQPRDEVTLRLNLALRYESGDLEQAGRVSLYRGPILLCSDDRFRMGPPTRVDVTRLNESRLVAIDAAIDQAAGPFRPWLMLDLPAYDGKTLRLIDFASAGATGKGYESWLEASSARPPRPVAWQPADGAKIGPGAVYVTWRTPAVADRKDRRHTVVISDSPSFEQAIIRYGDEAGARLTIPAEVTGKLQPGKVYYWKVIARNRYGQSESIMPYKRFTVEAATGKPRPKSVRIIYLVSADRTVREDFKKGIETAAKDLQAWYAKQLNGPTFRLNDPTVEVVKSDKDAKWFYSHPDGDEKDDWGFNNGLAEARRLVGAWQEDAEYIWVIYSDGPGNKGQGGSGVAVLPEDDLLGLVGQHPEQKSVKRWIAGLGHELGHAFGLAHPRDTEKYGDALMWAGIYGKYPDQTYLTEEDKGILMKSPFFFHRNGDPVVKPARVAEKH